MPRTIFLGTGFYVPERVVTNHDIAEFIDTSDEWIQQRTGIKERRWVDFENNPMGASDLGAEAAKRALDDAGVHKDEVDCIINATLSPDKIFPGDGVAVQAKLDIPAGVPCYDIRNQCSGFLYGLQMADSFVRSGLYKRILFVGAEVHSTGLQMSDKGRDVTVIFGDGAGAVVLGPNDLGDDDARGILSTHVHADGRYRDNLQVAYPSSAMMPRLDSAGIESGDHFPHMDGKLVFKHAVTSIPEVIMEALAKNNLTPADIDVLVPHQANMRINEMVAKRLEFPRDKVVNNIQKYGNTTAASIPIALSEARADGRIAPGALVCFAAFGSGFTWGAALVRF